jgi:hypothetical protein
VRESDETRDEIRDILALGLPRRRPPANMKVSS